ncbi:MAG: hypothetical protein BWX54_02062 [Verrucomicrobia bacterium ADurb.Bin018]|nr:MAG: hypothetical protein BWX54_02062 [Verrucomicrobia bacterium ADurb.Bin018]
MVSADSAHIKPKVCKTCGNPNHPLEAQCRYCGGRLRVRMDWFCTVCIVLIAVTLLALAGYIMHHRVRMPSRPGAVEFIEPTP